MIVCINVGIENLRNYWLQAHSSPWMISACILEVRTYGLIIEGN